MYRARNKCEAKRLACRIASTWLIGGLASWDVIDGLEVVKEQRRFVEAMNELIEELDRRGKTS